MKYYEFAQLQCLILDEKHQKINEEDQICKKVQLTNMNFQIHSKTAIVE